MQNDNLNITKKKLTILFTFLVFGIVILLEVVFFSSKYYSYINTEKTSFDLSTKSIGTRFVSLNDFVINFDLEKRLFRFNWERINNSDISFLIITKKSQELVFSNVTDNIKWEFVKKELEENAYNNIDQEDNYLVKKIWVSDRWVLYDILFIKKLKYSFSDYLSDLAGFIFVTLLFSIGFYYIWLRFVNKNLEPVEQNLKDMQDFIHNAGHELKTPISVISSNLQLLNELKSYDKDLTKESLEEIKRLDKLIEWLVELSDINSTEKKEDINLKEEVDLVIKDFSRKIEKKWIELDFIVKNNFILKASREYFYIFFSNLLWNAIKYNKKWWNIKVELNKNKLIISDTWLGISEQDIKKIWDRFYQVDKSRNSKGFGIWLSLVRKVADIYKWKINVKSKLWEWTSFEIMF